MVSPLTGSRRPGASRVTIIVIVAALLSISAVFGSSLAAYADGTAVSVTGPNLAWDEINNAPMTDLPTATVSQTENLVDQTVQVSWAHFSPSTNDPFSPTVPVQGIYYDDTDLYPVLVLQCRGTRPPNDLHSAHPSCYPTSAGRTDGPGGLGNAVYSVTNPDGSGQVSLHVENAQTNSVLGCDAKHACSIVVLPVFGGRQGPNDKINCNDHSMDYPTEANGYVSDAGITLASGALFGAACSWANRLVIPLHFAATPTNCPKASPAFSAAGSPMLSRAMQQWQAGWCHGSAALSFDYNSTNNEYQARSSFLSGGGALTSATDVALTTQPDDSGGRKHTYAPIANTDIAIAFVIDNPRTGRPIQDLTLSARLVAKLLTQSYSLRFTCPSDGDTTKQSTSCDPAVKGNPSSIFADPEFLALNPQITAGNYASQNLAAGDFLPTVVSGNSDLIWTLTSWVASDPDARAFLAGQSDPWGTHVNTYYRGSEYPTSQLRELDPGYVDPGAPAGNGTMQNSWQPVNGLDRVGQLLVGNSTSAISNDQSACSAQPCPFPRVIDQLGARALFAVVDQGTASAYEFPTARLINAAGRAVAPSTAGVSAALAHMRTNADGITQSANFASTDAAAYPLSVVDYAMLPTCGLTARTVTAVRSFLAHVSSSQTYGVEPGAIAPGYLGLSGRQLKQLASASGAVSSTKCHPTPITTTTKTHAAAAHPSSHTSQSLAPTTSQRNGSTSEPNSGVTPPTGAGGVSNPVPIAAHNTGVNTGSSTSLEGTSAPPASNQANQANQAQPANQAQQAQQAQQAHQTKQTQQTQQAQQAQQAQKQTQQTQQTPSSAVPTRLAAFGYKAAPETSATRFVLPGLLALGALLLLAGPGVFFAFTTGAAGVISARTRLLYAKIRRRR